MLQYDCLRYRIDFAARSLYSCRCGYDCARAISALMSNKPDDSPVAVLAVMLDEERRGSGCAGNRVSRRRTSPAVQPACGKPDEVDNQHAVPRHGRAASHDRLTIARCIALRRRCVSERGGGCAALAASPRVASAGATVACPA